MRKIKTIDDITKDGKVEFGEGYEFVGTAEEADAILMRATGLHGYELPPVPTATPSRSSSWACWCFRAAASCSR